MKRNNKERKSVQPVKKKEKRFDVLFEKMPEALFLHDTNGQIQMANQNACDALRLTKDCLETMNISDFVSEGVINSMREGLNENAGLFRMQTNYERKDHTKVPIEITSQRIMLGETKMTLTGFRNISIRKNYENELIEAKTRAESNENELRLIFNNSPSSIFVFDENMNVLRVNKKAIRNFKIHNPAAQGQKIGDFINCTNNNCNSIECGSLETCQSCKLSYLFKETTKGKNFKKEEVSISFNADGTVLHKTVLVSTSVLRKNGHSIYLATIDDISKRKQMELDLRSAKEHAEESDKLKSAFIQNLHHEIRTPLNGIIGFIDFLVDDTYEFTTKEKKELRDVMHKSGDRLTKTIGDLLEISELDSGSFKLNKERFDLKLHLDNFIELQRGRFENFPIEFLYEIDPILTGKTIQTDKSKFFKILQNLMDNALKFTETGYIRLQATITKDVLNISVEDSGIGIHPRAHDLIFKPFWQVYKDLDRLYEGNGLGLAVAKKTATTLGGDLVVKSGLGMGSTFSLKLPNIVNDSTPPRSIPTNPYLSKGLLKGKTILICEDQSLDFKYLHTVLLPEKCEIIRATNGLEGVEIFKENTAIDIVLMDIKMPGMNGFEASSKMRDIRSHIPIIAQTSYVLNGEKQRAMDAGCSDYLTKPIHKELLVSTILKYLKPQVKKSEQVR